MIGIETGNDRQKEDRERNEQREREREREREKDGEGKREIEKRTINQWLKPILVPSDALPSLQHKALKGGGEGHMQYI